ncbi:hypothetical protein Lal_00017048 [Lupinus albus]|nr:hypothetical protein Lal_00017048 [Lupinus albus]
MAETPRSRRETKHSSRQRPPPFLMAAVATRKGINGDDGISPSSSILLLFFLSHRRWREAIPIDLAQQEPPIVMVVRKALAAQGPKLATTMSQGNRLKAPNNNEEAFQG